MHPPALDHPLVVAAAAYAVGVHHRDVRKGRGGSYFEEHLVPVAELVAATGGDAVQVAAAYLHDTAEDHGGHARIVHIAAYFGDDVAQIVADLSDSLVDTDAGEEKAPWHERKAAYIDALVGRPRRSLEVALADKLHNATAIRDDVAAEGDAVWARFTVSDPADHCWYYGALATVFADRLGDCPNVVALKSVVADLMASAGLTESDLAAQSR